MSISALLSIFILLFGWPNIDDMHHVENVVVDLILIVAIGPFFESFLLTYPTSVAKTAIKSDLVAAIVGASFIAALHAFSGVSKVFFMLPGFSIQAFAYIQLRKSQNSYWTAFFFVFALHALHNATTMVLDCLDDF